MSYNKYISNAETQAELRAIKKAQQENNQQIQTLEKWLEQHDQNLAKA